MRLITLPIVLIFFCSWMPHDNISGKPKSNPYLKVNWKSAEKYKVTTGFLAYGDNYDCDINKKKYQSNESSEAYFCNEIDRQLAAVPDDKKNVLIYIHGFGAHRNRYCRKNNKTIQKEILSHDDIAYGVLASLRWEGGVRYNSTIDKCVDLGGYYASVIIKTDSIAKQHNPDAKISIIAHSMGNRVMQGVIQTITSDGSDIQFDHYIAASPDIEPDIFETDMVLGNVCDLFENVTIYRHNNDRVLGIAEEVSSSQRLGLRGINNFDLVSECIKQIDFSLVDDLSAFDFTNHNYFLKSPTARRDIYNILSGNSKNLFQNRKEILKNRKYVIRFGDEKPSLKQDTNTVITGAYK